MKTKIVAMILVLLSISEIAFAGTSVQTGDLTITSVEFDNRIPPGQVQIYTNEELPNPDECRLNHRYVFTLSDDGAKAMLSMLMSAQATGRKVRFNTDGCFDSVPKVVITIVK